MMIVMLLKYRSRRFTSISSCTDENKARVAWRGMCLALHANAGYVFTILSHTDNTGFIAKKYEQ